MILSFMMHVWPSKCLFQITHRKLDFTGRWMSECLPGILSQITGMLLQMSRNCDKLLPSFWHRILLPLASISQADFIQWACINRSFYLPIGKKNNSKIQRTQYNSKIQRTAEKKKRAKQLNKLMGLECDVEGQPVLLFFLTLPLHLLGEKMSLVCYFWFATICISTSWRWFCRIQDGPNAFIQNSCSNSLAISCICGTAKGSLFDQASPLMGRIQKDERYFPERDPCDFYLCLDVCYTRGEGFL